MGKNLIVDTSIGLHYVSSMEDIINKRQPQVCDFLQNNYKDFSCLQKPYNEQLYDFLYSSSKNIAHFIHRGKQ